MDEFSWSLLTCSEDEFDFRVGKMAIKGLIDTITALQQEMAREQAKFNEISFRIEQVTNPNSREQADLSRQLLQSQTKLAMLMGRNAKCFNQQEAIQNTELLTELSLNKTSPVSSGKNQNFINLIPTENGADENVLSSDKTIHGTNPSPVVNGQNRTPTKSEPVPNDLHNKKDKDTVSAAKHNTSNSARVRTYAKTNSGDAFANSLPWHSEGNGSSLASTDSDISSSATTSQSRVIVHAINKTTRNTTHTAELEKNDMSQLGYVLRNTASDHSLSSRMEQDMNSRLEHEDSENVAESIDFGATRNKFEVAAKKDSNNSKQHGSHSPKPARPLSSSVSFHGPGSTKSGDVILRNNQQKSNTDPKLRHSTPVLLNANQNEVKKSAVTMVLSKQRRPAPPPPSNQSGSVPIPAKQPSNKDQAPLKTQNTTKPEKQTKPLWSKGQSQKIPIVRGFQKTGTVANGTIVNKAPQKKVAFSRNASTGSLQTPNCVSSPNNKLQGEAVISGTKQFNHVDKEVVPTSGTGTFTRPPLRSVRRAPSVDALTENKPVVKSTNSVTILRMGNQTARPSEKKAAPPIPQEVKIKPTTPPPPPPVSRASPNHAAKPPAAPLSPMSSPSQDGFTAEEKVKDRVTLKNWDPTRLLNDLYKIELEPEDVDSSSYVNMEGYMEKLPINKKKATLLKTWKRRYFKAEDGSLHYSEAADGDDSEDSDGTDKNSGVLPLAGATIDELHDLMIGIDDGRGRYLVVKCPSERDYSNWTRALVSQTGRSVSANFVRPLVSALPHPDKRVIILDIGSFAVRAGILGHKPSLPQVMFPTVVATDKQSGQRKLGIEAFATSVRSSSVLTYPVRPAVQVDKFSLDIDVMPHLLIKVFDTLNVKPSDYWMMFSSPGNFSDKIKEQFMDIFIKKFKMKGANIVNQTLLSLYSYGAHSGIVVDIGERLEIVPVTDGYIVEGGVTRQPFGGLRVTEAFNGALIEKKYRFFTDVEFQIVRLAMQKLCFVSENFEEDTKCCKMDANFYRQSVNLDGYGLPDGSWTQISCEEGRFTSPEGLFDLSLWGMDNTPLHKLVHKAVQACPMDTRREMWRSIYLSGGLTKLPGFTERLQRELAKLVPSSIVVQVQAAPQRAHAAYIGACTLSSMDAFERAAISAAEWKDEGAVSLRRWHMF